MTFTKKKLEKEKNKTINCEQKEFSKHQTASHEFIRCIKNLSFWQELQHFAIKFYLNLEVSFLLLCVNNYLSLLFLVVKFI